MKKEKKNDKKRGKKNRYQIQNFSRIISVHCIDVASAEDDGTNIGNTGYEPWYYYIGDVVNAAMVICQNTQMYSSRCDKY